MQIMKYFPKTFTGLLISILLSISSTVAAVQVGPRWTNTPVPTTDSQHFSYARLDIPSLTLAIPTLDPGIPASTTKQQSKGIWPELRRTEAVWMAFQIRDEIRRINQFDLIVVSPDETVSAELYLLGTILESTGETLRLRYQLVDAQGRNWIKPTTVTHRVQIGWEERYQGQGLDPFQPLYADIAESVYKELKREAIAHQKQMKRFARLPKDRGVRLSNLQQIVATRRLVLASYFAPTRYSDTLAEDRKGRLEINYFPEMTDEEWAKIESVAKRETALASKLDGYYQEFVRQMEAPYRKWQKDTLSLAREARVHRAKRWGYTIAGTALMLHGGTALARDPVDERLSSDPAHEELYEEKEEWAALEVTTGAVLLVRTLFDAHKVRRATAALNELNRDLHTFIGPIHVQVGKNIVTLRGTAIEQFTQWRELLTEIFDSESLDLDAVQLGVASKLEQVRAQPDQPR